MWTKNPNWKDKASNALSVLALHLCAVTWSSCDMTERANSKVLDVERTPSEMIVRVRGNPTMIYQFAGGWKPYIKEFRNSSGINVIQDSPPDHPHHHGVMFAVRIEGVNFWEEQDQSGRQEQRRLLPATEGAIAGVSYVSFGQDLTWTRSGDSLPLLQETRRLTVFFAEDLRATLTDWRSVLTVPQGREGVILSGPKYVGFGVRFAASMNSGGLFRNANGQSGVRGTDGAEARWTAYSGPVGRSRVATVAVFGDANTPPRWFTLDEPFAYLAATLGLAQKPYRLPGNGSLELRYGLAAWDTNPEYARIEALYDRWQALTRTLPR